MDHDPRPADTPTLPPRLSPDDVPTMPPPADQVDTATVPPTVAPASVHNSPTVPGYSIEAELGRGGMGVVYRARQLPLNRPVALKMVLSGAHAEQKDLIRFLAEAEAVAAVKHPHVVQVYEYGEHEGRPYFAMEYLDGGGLSGLIRERSPLKPMEAASLIEKVARGVQAAHDLGIVHRDLKPANILLDRSGEPKVTDFGLAKRGGQSDLTRTGAIMGTPAYMAPEQARGETKFVGPAADVYALGVILFECLTGRTPFRNDDPVALIMQVATEEAPPVSRLVPNVPRDLELICQKCLSKDVHERYPTAGAFTDDLRRFLLGEPVTVRPAGRVERLVKWAKRKPTLAAAYGLSGTAIVLLLLVTGAIWLWQRAEGERKTAERERGHAEAAEAKADTARQQAEQARDALAIEQKATAKARDDLATAQKKLVRMEYSRSVDLAHREQQSNNLSRARELLDACLPELRGWEWRYVHRLCYPDLRTVHLPYKAMRTVAVTADGSRILAMHLGGGPPRIWDESMGAWRRLPGDWGSITTGEFSADASRVVLVDQEGKAHVCDLGLNPKPILLPAKAKIRFASFSPDGTKVATTGFNGPGYVWKSDSGELLYTCDHGRSGVEKAAYTAKLNRLITVDDSGGVRVWNATSGELLLSQDAHTYNVDFASVSPDGMWVATRNRQGLTQMRAVRKNAEPVTIGQPPHRGSTAYFSPDGSMLATCSQLGAIAVWDVTTATRISTLTQQGRAQVTAFSPDGNQVLTTSEDGVARIYDARTGSQRLELKGHIGWIRGAFVASGDRVITWGVDETVRLWDTTAGAGPLVIPSNRGAKQAALSPDGERVAFADSKNNICIREIKTGKDVLLKGHMYSIDGIVFSRDGKFVAAASSDRTARLWNAQTGELLHTLSGHRGEVHCVAFSPDGARVATGSIDKTIKVWNASTGAELATLEGHEFGISSVAFHPDRNHLVSASADGTAMIWDLATNAMLRVLPTESLQVKSAAYSPDGKRVVTSGATGTAQIWDAETGEYLLTLKGHKDRVHSASYSPDGKRVVTAGDDGTIKIWDPILGVEVLTLQGHRGWVYHASFAATGEQVISCGDDGTVRVWDARALNIDFYPRQTAPMPRVIAEEPKPKKPAYSPESSGLIGVWVAESLTTGGMTFKVPEGYVYMEFTADGKLLINSGKGSNPDQGTYSIDPTKNPREIDMQPPQRDEAPKLAIYRLDGDTLTLCHMDGPDAERPKKFESPKNSKVVIATWKRIKKK